MANPTFPAPGGPQARQVNVSRSTMFPLAGRTGLIAKTHFVPVIVTAVAGLLMFFVQGIWGFTGLYGNSELDTAFHVYWVLAAYISFMMNYYIYMLCGREKPWWLMAGVFAAMALLSWPPDGPMFFLAAHYNVFVDRLFSGGAFQKFFGNFFGPGLGEEFVKALPAAALALSAVYWKKNPLVQRIGVQEPLDGILIGVAAATGFAFAETMAQYLPHVIDRSLMNHLAVPEGATEVMVQEALRKAISEGAGSASFTGLVVLLGRGLATIVGHLAYSGVFGYFIGLAVLRPANAKRILLVGWLIAAALHGTWDGVATVMGASTMTSVLLLLVAALSYAFLASSILKARIISPTRADNFAAFGNSVPMPAGDGVPSTPAWSGPSPQPMAKPVVKPATATTPLRLKIGQATKTLAAGMMIEPPLLGRAGIGRGRGPIAEIVANPAQAGALGLRNLSDRVYRAKLPAGRIVDVAQGQIVRLEPGVVIDFIGIEATIEST